MPLASSQVSGKPLSWLRTVPETTMAHSWSHSYAKGSKAEANVALKAIQHGYNVHAIGAITGISNTPNSYFKDTDGRSTKVEAPDLILRKDDKAPIAIEAKYKEKDYGGYIYCDERRVKYGDQWSRITNTPVFWVIQLGPDTDNLLCMSPRKLLDTYSIKDDSKTDRNGNPEPALMVKTELFRPFTELLEGRLRIEISHNFYLLEEGKEPLLL